MPETYDRALEILCSMPREEYLSLLVHLLKAAGGKGDEKIAEAQRTAMRWAKRSSSERTRS